MRKQTRATCASCSVRPPYNSTITGSASLTTIGAGTGLAFLATSFTQSQINGCIVD